MATDKSTVRITSALSRVIAWPLLVMIKMYQLLLSPLLGQNCRFYPTCSQYARQALIQYGAFTGSWLAMKRIVKCHPFHPGGIDNVPNKVTQQGCCDNTHDTTK